MASTFKGRLLCASAANQEFRGVAYGDVLLHPTDSNQKMFIGNKVGAGFVTGSNAGICLSRNWVGVGTSNPQYPLHVAGQINNVSIYAEYDIAIFSDKRKKGDIRLINDALEKLDKIHGYTFHYTDVVTGCNIDGNNNRSAGVIAQEVLQVLPEVVDVDSKGYLNVRYGNMMALLIQSVKELKDMVVNLSNNMYSYPNTL
jgi:hypothetical protein